MRGRWCSPERSPALVPMSGVFNPLAWASIRRPSPAGRRPRDSTMHLGSEIQIMRDCENGLFMYRHQIAMDSECLKVAIVSKPLAARPQGPSGDRGKRPRRRHPLPISRRASNRRAIETAHSIDAPRPVDRQMNSNIPQLARSLLHQDRATRVLARSASGQEEHRGAPFARR